MTRAPTGKRRPESLWKAREAEEHPGIPRGDVLLSIFFWDSRQSLSGLSTHGSRLEDLPPSERYLGAW